jgi:hypothetical protein
LRLWQQCLRQLNRFFGGEEYLLDTIHTLELYQPSKASEPWFDCGRSRLQYLSKHELRSSRTLHQNPEGMLPKSQRVIQGEADVRRLVYWIRACYVLHNPALQDPVEAEWLEDEEEDDGGVPSQQSLQS